MKKLKQFGKYILIVIGLYIFSSVLIFIGLNVNYSDITLVGTLPEQITIEKAEATSSDGRIYGYVSNSKDDNVNDKYIKVCVYDENNETLTTEYLKITGVNYGDSKLFKVRFSVDDAFSYTISIVDSEID